MFKNIKGWTLFILIGFMGVFTFTDLMIAEKFYTQGTIYGSVFEIIGETPYFLTGLFSTAFLLVTAKKRCKSIVGMLIQQIIMFGLLISVANHYTVNLDHHAELELSKMQSYGLIAFIAGIFILFSIWLMKKVDIATVSKLAVCGVFMCLGNYIIINVMKSNFGRMRFRDMTNSAEQYTRWFVVNSKAVTDSFRSFPSGHTAGAATIFWFMYLPHIINMRKSKVFLYLFAWIWIILTMFSRVVEGAHFITDTTMSVIIMYSCYLILDYIFFNSKDKTKVI